MGIFVTFFSVVLVSAIFFVAAEPPPCGATCSYEGTERQGHFYPTIVKPVQCQNMIQRLGYTVETNFTTCLDRPPEPLFSAFAMSGKVHIQFLSDFKGFCYTGSELKVWKSPVCPWRNPDPYYDCQVMRNLLTKHQDRIRGKVGIVVGSENPWIECHLVSLGASKVITLEYSKMEIQDSTIIYMHPHDLATQLLEGTFPYKIDYAVSFSSLEHSGLTRYGDAVNPYGDLEAVSQIFCMTSPEAALFVGVPVEMGRDQIVWPLHRIYGNHRMPHLTANWDCFDADPPLGSIGGGASHGVVVCNKASAVPMEPIVPSSAGSSASTSTAPERLSGSLEEKVQVLNDKLDRLMEELRVLKRRRPDFPGRRLRGRGGDDDHP